MDSVVYITNDIEVSVDGARELDVDIEALDADIGVDISGVTFTTGGIPPGGDTGDVLVKSSPRDYHAEWMSLRAAGYNHIYYDTTANWNAQAGMISEEGAIYIYSDYSTDIHGNPIPCMKIGDGLAYLIDLPFSSQDLTEALFNHINDSTLHITQQERQFWSNKVTSVVDDTDPENLILTKAMII